MFKHNYLFFHYCLLLRDVTKAVFLVNQNGAQAVVLGVRPQGHREGGQAGTMTPGPMDFRGPMRVPHGLQEGRWLQRAQQRANELERGPSKCH